MDTSSYSNMSSPPLKKMLKKQSFRNAWLEVSSFAAWLQKCEDKYTAKCKVCKKTIAARKSSLECHMMTQTHQGNMSLKHPQKEEEGKAGTSCSFDLKIKQAEIRYCVAIVEHNLSFNSQNHFVAMNKIALPASTILQGIKLKRSKITAIIRNVISKHIKRTTARLLKNKCFSVLLDESTDVSEVKSLYILARYMHNSKIQTSLLDYVQIEEGKAEHLFQCFLHSLEKHSLSINNIVGITVDNANLMLDTHNSIVSRLLAANKEVVVFPCICHSMHLVASHACKCLPSVIDDFLHLISNYSLKSPERQEILMNTQKIMNAAQQKVLHPCSTRWLAHSECIQRILNQWEILFSIFAEACTHDNSVLAQMIFEHFNNPYTLAYLQFLNYVLDLFCKFNLIFQGSGVLVYRLLPDCNTFIRKLGGNFLKNECIEKVDNIHETNVEEEQNLRSLKEIFIGHTAASTIQKIRNSSESEIGIIEFYNNIKKFYINAFKGAVQRLPFNEPFLHALQFLQPEVALYISKHNNYIRQILNKFPTKFQEEAVVNEWQLLPMQFSLEEKELLVVLNVTEFWSKIDKITDLSGAPLYSNIFKVAELCLSLPHSNADVERFFSFVTEIKTRDRNRLKPETVSALTRIKLDLSNKNQTCVTYEISDDMLELFNNNMYERPCVPKKLQDVLLPDVQDTSDTDTD